MIIQKTEKARLELAPGVRTLGQRERTFLLLADGRRTLKDIRQVLQGEIDVLANNLIEMGFVIKIIPDLPVARSINAATPKPAPSPATAVVTKPDVAVTVAVPRVSADQFEGKRSMATTRMFLFDICDRMFVRKSPELADQFRVALRNARDRESMLAVGRNMLEEIEKVAGGARADSISERIAMLLPVEN